MTKCNKCREWPTVCATLTAIAEQTYRPETGTTLGVPCRPFLLMMEEGYGPNGTPVEMPPTPFLLFRLRTERFPDGSHARYVWHLYECPENCSHFRPVHAISQEEI